MAIFERTDWTQFDFWAIVANQGLAVIDERDQEQCHEWLERRNYQITMLDCRNGVTQLVLDLGRLLKWEQQFGYSLSGENRNLNSLRDGFEFDVPAIGGCVLELHEVDTVWREDAGWLQGLLTIAMEHSLRQLALGYRFFTLLVLPEGSPLIGVPIETKRVPWCYGPFRD